MRKVSVHFFPVGAEAVGLAGSTIDRSVEYQGGVGLEIRPKTIPVSAEGAFLKPN